VEQAQQIYNNASKPENQKACELATLWYDTVPGGSEADSVRMLIDCLTETDRVQLLMNMFEEFCEEN
jgi:hypothetical protein